MEGQILVIYATLLVALVVAIGVPAVAVYRENSGLTMRRWPFVLWVALCMIALPTVWSVVAALVPGLATDAVLVVIGSGFAYVFYQRVVRRARDAGRSKRIAYVGAIPLANLVVFVILMVVGSGQPVPSKPDLL